MRSFIKPFVDAARGIKAATTGERNFRFHLCAAVYVYAFSLFYPFGLLEYALLTILVGGVLALELANSAIERAVDVAAAKHSPLAGTAKDMAAGAVLVFSVAAAICGIALFGDVSVLAKIVSFYAANLWALALLLVSLGLSWCFVFKCYHNKWR